MKKFYKEKRDELVTCCMIINTILAGFSVSLQAFKPSAEPPLETPVLKNYQLRK